MTEVNTVVTIKTKCLSDGSNAYKFIIPKGYKMPNPTDYLKNKTNVPLDKYFKPREVAKVNSK